MTHEEFNNKVRAMAKEYHISETMARCYLVNYYTLHRCDRCKKINDCAFTHALVREKEEGNVI